MVSARDILTIQRTWKNEGNMTCGKYTAALINLNGEIIVQEPKPLLAQDEVKIKEHAKRVKKALGAEIGNGIVSQGFLIQPLWFLDNLVDSALRDTKALDALLKHIEVNTQGIRKNPLEVLIYHCIYDIPGKKENGEEVEDSEYVYKHIIVLVCETKMQKHELAVKAGQEDITIPQRLIKQPITGFVFPSFENMRPVDDEIIIYNADTEHPLHALYGNMEVKGYRTADEIMRDFDSLFTEEIGEGRERDTCMMAIMEVLGNMNPFDQVDKETLRHICREAQVALEDEDAFLAEYHDSIGKYKPTANQLIIPKYAAMRARDMHRERRKALLLKAAAAVQDETLANDLREEAER